MTCEVPWLKNFTRSLDKTASIATSRFFQLATCDERGQPHNRTVVHRELETGSPALLIVSDLRSDKCQHLLHNAAASVCWYFNDTREQYRFACQGRVLTAQQHPELLKRHWLKLSESSRESYFSGPPKTPKAKAAINRSDSSQAPGHFCVIRLIIATVDYLDLTCEPHNRALYRKKQSGDWSEEAVFA